MATAFGKEMMKKEFMLNADHTFLNQGSFGSAPSNVLEHRIRCWSNVVWFFYYIAFLLYFMVVRKHSSCDILDRFSYLNRFSFIAILVYSA